MKKILYIIDKTQYGKGLIKGYSGAELVQVPDSNIKINQPMIFSTEQFDFEVILIIF